MKVTTLGAHVLVAKTPENAVFTTKTRALTKVFGVRDVNPS